MAQSFDSTCDSGLISLVLTLRFYGVSADFGQISYRLGVVGIPEMLRCARELALKAARATATEWSRLGKAAFPPIAQRTDVGFFIRGKLLNDTVLVQDPRNGRLRTYVFTHTTNRIDDELGGRLFRHLVAPPIDCFARGTGDSAARVLQLKNIRNFNSNAALTLVIDLFFTFVFPGVMFYYSSTLTWVVLGSFPFHVANSAFVTPLSSSRLEERFNRGAENQAFLVECVNGVETPKAMAVKPQMQPRWEEQFASYRGRKLSRALAGQLGEPDGTTTGQQAGDGLCAISRRMAAAPSRRRIADELLRTGKIKGVLH